MSKIIIQFSTDNQAFENDKEINFVLDQIKEKLSFTGQGTVFDSNGNKIGQFETIND